MSKQFITTPIYYVNDEPHIGHAYTSVAADIFARYQKQSGDDVYLLTGTDEHGAKIAKAALDKSEISNLKSQTDQKAGEKNNPIIQDFTDQISQKFKQTADELNISYTQFIRTTNPKHEQIVQDLLTKIYEKGYIYKGKYRGLYCVGCEEYKKEGDLINSECPIHKKKVEKIEEEVWFFKLSAFQEKIAELIDSDALKISPKSRLNEVMSFVSGGLEDIAISRSQVDWGIPVPWDKAQTIYVWVDALINYYSATIIDSRPDLFPPDVHFIGKDILRFHAVIWPALLLAADLPTPKQIVVHGFFTINNHKMSKSLGNTIQPKELIEKYGIDATRYLLMSFFPFGEDGDFSLDKLQEKYNSNLVNGLGNLVQRTLVVANKLEVRVDSSSDEYENLDKYFGQENFKFFEATEYIQSKIQIANQYIDKEKPWALEAKSPKAQQIINQAVFNLKDIANLITPFTPETSAKILNQIKTGQAQALFPRIVKQ